MKRLPFVSALFFFCLAGCEGQPAVEQKSQAMAEENITKSKSSAKSKTLDEQKTKHLKKTVESKSDTKKQAAKPSEGQDAVSKAMRELRSPELNIRSKAADSLVLLASEEFQRKRRRINAKQIHELAVLACNSKEDSKVRGKIVRAIGFLGTHAKEIIPMLIKVLIDEKEDEHVRSWIAMILPEMGPNEKIAPAILTASRSTNENVSINASMYLLGLNIKPAVLLSWAKERMNHASPRLRRDAIGIAGGIARKNKNDKQAVQIIPQAMQIILRGLVDPDKMVQQRALEELNDLKPESKTTKAAISDLLKHPDLEVRVRAAVALINISKENHEKYLEIPIKALQSQDSAVRVVAVIALGSCGKKAAKSVPALTERLKDESCMVKVFAANSLAQITGDHGKYLAPLIEVLQGEDSNCGGLAVGYLSILAPQAPKEAQPLLLKLIESTNTRTRSYAFTLLHCARLEDDRMLILLSEALEDKEATVRAAAIRTLGMMGGKAKLKLPQIIQAKEDKNEGVRQAARWAEWNISSPPAGKK